MRCVNELQITTLIVTGKGVYRVDFGDPRSEGGGAGGGNLNVGNLKWPARSFHIG